MKNFFKKIIDSFNLFYCIIILCIICIFISIYQKDWTDVFYFGFLAFISKINGDAKEGKI